MSKRFSKLTRAAIRAVEPGASVTEYGITANKLENGDVRFSVNVMVDGQRIHRTIGLESEGVTRTQAETFIENKRAEAREGRLNLPRGRKLRLTFKCVACKYLELQDETGAKNVKTKRRHVEQRLIPFFGDQVPQQISRFTIDRYKKRRIEEGAAAGTVNRELATLSHLFRTAVHEKWIDSVPAKATKLDEGDGRIIALSDEECDALVQAAIADADPDCWLFVVFALNTAMRHSEILRARFDAIDWTHRRLYIGKAKAGAREQPLTVDLVEILRREREMREDREGWIFPTPRPGQSGTGHRDRMSKPFQRAVVRAGLNPAEITPHVMRHTAITKLVQQGVDLPTIQRISGHKTLAMVMRYTHVHGRHIDAAMDKLGRTIPERDQNASRKAITHELHTRATVTKLT